MADPLADYRGKRSRDRTPEPVPAADEPRTVRSGGDSFVVQEHHARALHWDFRLERDGVLVSWAVPKGLPMDPKANHLAVHTEDHPLEYASFAGSIPAGEYGGGDVAVWDSGHYETEKWLDDEVKVVLHGSRVSGRYVLIRTDGKNWIMHRMDPPADPDWRPLPRLVQPMLATAGTLPPASSDEEWAYEMKWDGVRAMVYVEGGRARVLTRNDREVSGSYPELARLAASLGTRQVVLDGEVVAFDGLGRPSFGLLQQRMHVTSAAQVRELAKRVPVTFLAFDVVHLDGRGLLDASYEERREMLEGLGLEGSHWAVPPVFVGAGSAAVAASQAQGLEGIVAKRRSSRYEPGRRSRSWVKVKNIRTQEVVVGGWRPGKGARQGGIGSLLVGVPGAAGLDYVGHVGTGFSEAQLADLLRVLAPTITPAAPFSTPLPAADARDAVFVEPFLVGEVAFGEWTADGRLRHPTWRGLRDDKSAADVRRES